MHLERHPLAGRGQAHAVVGLVLDQPQLDSSRLTIADADAGDTSSRSASADVRHRLVAARCASDQIAFA